MSLEKKESIEIVVSVTEQNAEATLDFTGPESALPPDDHVFGERYENLGILGRGGIATVYKLRDKFNDDTVVAAKLMHRQLLTDPLSVQRFQQEAAMLQTLEHVNVARIFSCSLTEYGAPYFIMEYVPGQSLADYLADKKHLPINDCLEIFEQIIAAVEYTHDKGIIHRDLKPGNIMLLRKDAAWIVKVVDFGIAKVLAEQDTSVNKLTQTGDIFGSPAYMSPEQCVGSTIDTRTDIYSLGCVMHEALTGRNPFYAHSPVQAIINHLEFEPEPFYVEFKHLNIPKELEKIVLTCIKKEPQKRVQTASILHESVRQLMKRLHRSPGLGRRTSAFLLDILIFLSVAMAINPALTENGLIQSLLVVAYVLIFECSKLHATPGMLLTKMRIKDSLNPKQNALHCAARICLIVATWCAAESLLKIGHCLVALGHPEFQFLCWSSMLLIAFSFANLLSSQFRRDKKTWLESLMGRTVLMNQQITTGFELSRNRTFLEHSKTIILCSIAGIFAFLPLSDAFERWTEQQPGVRHQTPDPHKL